ncbi:LacI family DNA-binding transcriptional regulator [Spirilliplanes yamanashiensis]
MPMPTSTPAGRSPTLDEVAALAGVGRGTVSRVLNDSPQVTEATRAAVRRAIETLGYVPNRAARSLVTRRSDSVAVVISESDSRVFTEPFFGGFIRGVTEGVAESGLQLLLAMARTTPERDRLHRFLAGRHVDGVLLASLHRDDPLPQLITELRIPAVSVGRIAGDLPYVDADNAGGAHAAVTHLHATGRRRIATITGPLDMDAGAARLAGYHDALAAAGVPRDESLVAVADWSEESGRAAMAGLLAAGAAPDAVFVASDLMASGAMQVLAEHGLRVPEDVAVIGFDDSTVARHTRPQLTSVHQPVSAMGLEMVRLLRTAMAGGDAPDSLVLPTRLVLRESA